MSSTKSRILSVACPVALSGLVIVATITSGARTVTPSQLTQVDRQAQARLVDETTALKSIPTDQPVFITVQLRDGVTSELRGDRLAITTGTTIDRTKTQGSLLADLTTTRLISAEGTNFDLASVVDLQNAVALAGLDDFYTVTVPAGQDAAAVLKRLAKDPNVETAYVKPIAVNASLDYSASQFYASAAPTGIGQAAAAKVAGGLGQNVQIFDIEGNWNLKHEDLPGVTFIANGTFYDNSTGSDDPLGNFNHGTAVLGELVARNNGFGVTGLVPNAAMNVVNASNTSGAAIAEAVTLAAAHAKPGDVILIEQQYNRDTRKGYQDNWPVEAFKADFLAIKAATDKGVIVVEAAGNGRYDPTTQASAGNNLDTILSFGDSGAIMVGAGQVSGCYGSGQDIARSRADFSNYGATVDLQGPGECVTTLGYGNLTKGTGQNSWYTNTFNGTSSASPVVTGAAAIMSSIIEQRTGRAATPAEIRALLMKTGTAQDGSVGGQIGPMPNLAKAIASLPAVGGQGGDLGGNVGGSDRTAPTVSGPVARPAVGFQLESATKVPTTISWGATDTSGIAAFAVMCSTDGGDWADVTLNSATAAKTTLDLLPGHTYRFAVAAKDGAGNWSEWRVGSTVSPSLDDDTDPNLAYSGSWARRTWTSAFNGAVTATGTAGDTVTVEFHGKAIGWIASRGTTRGVAHVWLDGKDLGTVNLYSATTLARSIVFSAAVSEGVTHKLIIQAVGTVDLDGLAFLG